MPFRPFSRDLVYAMPPILDDWVAHDHPVRFVAAFVAALSDEEWQAMGISRVAATHGAPAYHPEMLVSAWLAGFMLGIRSSRALEAACRDSVALRWLTGNQQPDHNTLWRCYQAHRAGMRLLLRRTVTVALEAGLLDLAVVAIDGSKISGSAARERSYDEAGLLALLARTEQAIAALEAQQHADADDPPRLPPRLSNPQALRAQVTAALARVQAADGPPRCNLTDPDAILMPGRRGWLAGYNAQAAVTPVVADAVGIVGQFITAAEVTQAVHDQGQLLPLLAASRATTGRDADVALADGGYHAGENLAACREQGQVVVMPEAQRVALGKPYHQRRFVYDAQQDCFSCPMGACARFVGEKARSDRPTVRIYRVGGAICRACAAFGTCTTDARQGRSLEVSVWMADLSRHRVWMETEEATALARLRKTLPEPVFGILKEQQGVRRFLLRGLDKVTAEWRLLATAFNLRVLARYWRQGRLVGVLSS